MRIWKKALVWIGIMILAVGLCVPASVEAAEPSVLRIGSNPLSGVLSPFYSYISYDMAATGLTQEPLLAFDREALPVHEGINGETRAFDGRDYTYRGIADVAITTYDDTSADYVIRIRDDVKFSDGTPMTIDDVIFTMYVLCDPSYDGSIALRALPIQGLVEYFGGMEPLQGLILQAGENGQSPYATAEQTAYYWDAFHRAGRAFARDILDYCRDFYSAEDDTEAADIWGYGGYGIPAEGGEAALWSAILDRYGYDIPSIDIESAGQSFTSFLMEMLGEQADTYFTAVSTGSSASSIAGITKLDQYSMKIHFNAASDSIDASLAFDVAPLHYYGDPALFNGVDSFGFHKGDLRDIRAKSDKPMGAGPYAFESYKDGVLTLVKNENYYLGAPLIDRIEIVEGCVEAKDVISGTVDLVEDASFDIADLGRVRELNANGTLDGDKIAVLESDYPGYGYIGINAERVKVGDDRSSRASMNLRKAYATVLAACRDTAIADFYGDMAGVIEYPVSNTSWTAPRPSDPGYERAFSRDVNGDAIYRDGMTEAERYDAALKAAKGFLEAAGFAVNAGEGKFTDVPAVTAAIPCSDGDHPSYGVFKKASDLLATIGVELTVREVPDSMIFFGELQDGLLDMWGAAWAAAADPDLYPKYNSEVIPGSGSGTNHYYITDAALDLLMIDARSGDTAQRKSLYKDCYDIIMDWACELPLYQRKTMTFVSAESVNTATLPKDTTAYWTWSAQIHTLEPKNAAVSDPNPFTDVGEDKYYYAPVLWAVENKITNGTDDTHFSPDNKCTRGQVVTFLWRAAGSPEPKKTDNPFTDVKDGKYYYKAVLWAVENNITAGISATAFGPDNPCTRGQVVTFLWRAKNKPSDFADVSAFKDVAAGKYYYDPVRWAVKAGVTQGTSKTAFSPDGTCTRGQIVTFLYRAYT